MLLMGPLPLTFTFLTLTGFLALTPVFIFFLIFFFFFALVWSPRPMLSLGGVSKSFKAHIKSSLCSHEHHYSVDVQPGAGLMQFSADSLHDISVPSLIKALGNNYMSSISGVIRRWRTGLTSLQPCNFGHHVVLPSWGSDDWVVKDALGMPTLY